MFMIFIYRRAEFVLESPSEHMAAVNIISSSNPQRAALEVLVWEQFLEIQYQHIKHVMTYI